MVMMVLAASANSVRYFTRSQANRVARTLDAQNELMIYCGYEYELATYVIVNEVWAERVNSKYYEIWLYGYDAYTGEEIYMPVDLACIWLYNSYGNRMYSAAQYLRFRSTVATPNFYWTMPPYNPFVRHFHDPHFNHCYTYHYEIHRYGWRPPMPPPHGGPWAYHPYYMRTPHTPAPVPPKPFTPGVNYPQTPDGHGYLGGSSRNSTGTRSTAFNNAGGARTGDNMNNAGNPGTTNRNSNANAQPSGPTPAQATAVQARQQTPAPTAAATTQQLTLAPAAAVQAPAPTPAAAAATPHRLPTPAAAATASHRLPTTAVAAATQSRQPTPAAAAATPRRPPTPAAATAAARQTPAPAAVAAATTAEPQAAATAERPTEGRTQQDNNTLTIRQATHAERRLSLSIHNLWTNLNQANWYWLPQGTSTISI